MDTTHIYGLIDPRDGRIRYVGKADDVKRRLTEHVSKRKEMTHKRSWIVHLSCLGLKPEVIILDIVPESGWQTWEREWIADLMKNHDLVNGTDGGDGAKGHKYTWEQRCKISNSKRGKHLTAEHRRKISEGMKGRITTAETRLKLSKAGKRQVITDEHRRHISEAHKGIKLPPRTEEHLRRFSEARMGHVVTQETRLKLKKAHTGKKQTEKTKLKRSVSLKAYNRRKREEKKNVNQ